MDNTILDSFGFLLLRVVRAHRNLIRSEMHQLGLHRGQPHALFVLDKQDGLSHSELAEILEVTPATLTNKIKGMEKANLVLRRRDQEDERVSRIYMTDKGRGIMDELRRSMVDMESILLAGFSKAEINRLKDNMEKILLNIDAFENSPGSITGKGKYR